MMETFTPSDPNFEARVRSSADRQVLLTTMGASLALVRPGEIHVETPYDTRFSQQDGFLHGGIVAAMLDTACGYAAFTLMPANSRVLAVEFKVNLLSPARGDLFRAEGHVIKPGRTLTVCEGRLLAIHKGQETLCALMQATMICIQE